MIKWFRWTRTTDQILARFASTVDELKSRASDCAKNAIACNAQMDALRDKRQLYGSESDRATCIANKIESLLE